MNEVQYSEKKSRKNEKNYTKANSKIHQEQRRKVGEE
jgi:hypothetical protein